MAYIEQSGYILVKDFLNPCEIDLLTNYTKIKHRSNFDSFDEIQNNNGDTYFYGDPIMESLMLCKQNKIEKIINLKLIPTYAFWRMYSFNAELKKHTDRPSCEISVTININGDGTDWPIYMNNNPVILKTGDACIYLGEKVEHWRDFFKGDWQSQVFMHYVNADGPYTNQAKDGRLIFGVKK